MGSTAMLAGTVLQGTSSMYGGMRQKVADDASAAMMAQQGGQAMASAEQGAIIENMRGQYVASNARARTAAGGMTTTGTSAVDNTGRILGMGEYRARSALYSGASIENEDAFRAAVLRDEGSAAQTAGFMGAFAGAARSAYAPQAAGWRAGINTVLTKGASFFEKYGDPPPDPAKLYADNYDSGEWS